MPDEAPPPLDEIAERRRTAFLRADIHDIDQLIATGILSQAQARSPLFRPAITYALICLGDLLGAADGDGRRVTDVENVFPTGAERDLTSLIRAARNAACHVQTGHNDIGNAAVRYYVVNGSGPPAFIGGIALRNDFADDVAIFFGELRVYLKRNILLARDRAAAIYG